LRIILGFKQMKEGRYKGSHRKGKKRINVGYKSKRGGEVNHRQNHKNRDNGTEGRRMRRFLKKQGGKTIRKNNCEFRYRENCTKKE